MNYCIYNRELDKFLYLFYLYDEGGLGAPVCRASWDDEFVYALAGSKENIPVETVWPEDTTHDNYFLYVCRRIDEMDTSKNGMKDVKFIPVTDGVPDFEKEYFLI